MRFKDIKARELGYTRRISELEAVLYQILLACEIAVSKCDEYDVRFGFADEAVEIIEEKCKQVLDIQ